MCSLMLLPSPLIHLLYSNIHPNVAPKPTKYISHVLLYSYSSSKSHLSQMYHILNCTFNCRTELVWYKGGIGVSQLGPPLLLLHLMAGCCKAHIAMQAICDKPEFSHGLMLWPALYVFASGILYKAEGSQTVVSIMYSRVKWPEGPRRP